MNNYKIEMDASETLIKEQFKMVNKRNRFVMHEATMKSMRDERERIETYPCSDDVKNLLTKVIDDCLNLQPIWAKMNEKYEDVEGDFKTIDDALTFASTAYNYILALALTLGSEDNQ